LLFTKIIELHDGPHGTSRPINSPNSSGAESRVHHPIAW
jgi:hypothetical protein